MRFDSASRAAAGLDGAPAFAYNSIIWYGKKKRDGEVDATLRIGCHLSSAKGYLAMGREAVALGANTFQFFTRNPRGGRVKPIDEADITAYVAFAAENDIGPVVAHAPYTLNACSGDPDVRDFAFRAMSEDLARLERVPGCLYNFHPGCHVGQGVDVGIEQIAGLLNRVLRPEARVVVLLETMAGKGSEVGGRFEELRAILDRVTLSERMGVCLDTCHVHDAGYDIAGDLDGVLTAFDKAIGLDRLKAVHLNDSLHPLGARKDRHARLGEGKIGLEALLRVVRHPALRNLPFLLETPNDLDGYAKEIAMVKERCI